MPIEVPPRGQGQAQGQGLPPGARIVGRTARPLTGREVGEALRGNVSRLVKELGDEAGFGLGTDGVSGPDHWLQLVVRWTEVVERGLEGITELGKINAVWPNVEWSVELVLATNEARDRANLAGTIVLRLDPMNERIKPRLVRAQSGDDGEGLDVRFERIGGQARETRPDAIRQEHGLGVEVDVQLASGIRTKHRLPGEPGPRIARSVEIGPGAPLPSFSEAQLEPAEAIQVRIEAPQAVELPSTELLAEPAVVPTTEPVSQSGATGGVKPGAQLRRPGQGGRR